ncbi:hypothetical protein D3C87_936770 [compost metagenome]
MDMEIRKDEAEAAMAGVFGGPSITQPLPGVYLTPGFLIEARAREAAAWRLEIYTGPTLIHSYNQARGPFSYQVPSNLIAPGTKFYFRIDYAEWPTRSAWAWSGDKVMGLEKPIIHPPSQVSTDKPLVFGRGYPGATIKLYEAGYGGVVHGSGVVDNNGEWRVQVTEKLRPGEFPMTANQTLNDAVSDWAQTATFVVHP